MEAWFKVGELQSKIGKITDYFINYIELYCEETKQFYIVHENKVTIIKK